MKTQLLRVLFAGILLCMANVASAQRYITDIYGYACYNYFDNTNIITTTGTAASPTTTTSTGTPLVYTPGFSPDPSTSLTSSVTITAAGTNSLSTTTGRSLQSRYQVTPQSVAINNIPNAADASYRALGSNDWEWSFLYKSNLTGTNRPNSANTYVPISGNVNSWRYWLHATTSTISATTAGFFVTQDNDGYLRMYTQSGGGGTNSTQTFLSSLAALNNGVTYCVKIQRVVYSGGFRWKMYLDVYNAATPQAKTLQGTSNTEVFSISLNYTNSVIETQNTIANSGAFQWDEMHMYTRYLQFVGVTSAANGVTPSPLYANQSPVILYGMQLYMRGNYDIGSSLYFSKTESGYFEGNLNNSGGSATIYKTTNSVFSAATASASWPATVYGANVQASTVSDSWVSSGNTDGTLTSPGYYFISTATAATIPSYALGYTSTFTGVSNVTDPSTGSSAIPNVVNTPGTTSTIYFGVYVAPPTASAPPRCGAGQVTFTASGGTPSGGTYNWYTAASGGTAVATGTTYSPTIVTTKTYYVSYTTGGNESARTAVTATINPIVTSPLTNASISYSFSGNTMDISGNQNDGVPQSAPTLTTDRYGFSNSAYNFNGTNQWMTSTTAISGPSVFTMSLWFKTTTTTGGKLLSFSSGQTTSAQGGYDRHLYMTNSGQLVFGVYNNGGKTITSPAATPYNDGNWHHVVITLGNTSGMVMYVDNTSVANLSTYYAPETRTGYWKIGYDENGGVWPNPPTSWYFNGAIDDVAVYNSELTSTAVSNLNDVNQIGAYAPVCLGSPLTIYAPTITGATFTWTPPSGSTVTGNPGVFSSAVAGAYSLSVTGGPGSCSSTATYTPTVNTPPGSTFTATSPVVVNGPSTVTLTSTYDAAATYTWSFNGGVATGSTQAGYSVTWATTGTKTISLTATKNGCSSTTTQTVVVGFTAPTISGTTICGAGNATLSVTSPVAGATYNWYIDNTTTTTLQSGTATSYTGFFGGTTILYVSYTSALGTSLRAPATVTVNPKASSSINSPMLSYPFESGSLTDWSGLGNNGTLQGTTLPIAVADRNNLAGSAFSFSGTNANPQYISTTTSYAPLVFSFSVWFKTTVAGGKLIGLGGGQTGTNVTQDRNLYMNDAGQLYYGVYNGTVPVTINTPVGTAYNDGLWHHVVVTDGPTSGMVLYVDGVSKVSTPTYTAPQGLAGYWRIGGDGLLNWPSRPTNDYFVGTLDDVAIYNHELTAAESTSNDMNLYKFSASYCANNSLIITAQNWPGTPTYSWVDNANTSLTFTGNPVTFSKATTTNYTLTTTTNGCSQNTAIVTPTMQTYTWTGAAGTTDVTTAGNWTNTSTGIAAVAPALTGGEYIIIPTNAGNKYPVLAAPKSVYTLNIASGAKLDLGSYTLSVGCNIFNSGTLTKGSSANFNTSAITWSGGSAIAAQSFTGNSTAASTDVGNMTVSNAATGGTVTLTTGKLDVYNVLTLTTGKLVVSSPATLTLKSVATQTATVAAIPSGLSITGNVSVERYIAGGASKRGYRLLTSPVNNGSGVFSLNYLQASAYVTGTTKTAGGFDLSPNANNPSIYFFRENTLVSNTTFSSGNYRGVNNILTNPNYSFDNESGTFTLPSGNGFLFFFRGDRNVGVDIGSQTVASYVPTGTTFTTTGTLNSGNITVKNWYSQTTSLLYSSSSNTGVKTVTGFNLVANPYASTINIEKFNRQASQAASSIYGNGFPNESGTTLSSPLKIWVYNPTNKQYSTYEQKSTNISSADTISNQNPGISSDGYASNLIASGQGFFIRATASNQTLTFRESAKTNYQPSSTITQAVLSAPHTPITLASTSKFTALAAMSTQQLAAASASTADDGRESLLRFTMIKDTINTDAIVIGLKTDISPVYDGDKDAEDLGGNGAQVSLSAMSSDSVKATIYRSPYPHKVQQVIPLYADATASGAYQLNLTDVGNLPVLYEVWLKDSFTKDSVNIKASKLYNFNIDKGNAASFGKDRFRLILRQDPALGLRLIDFTASKVAVGAKTAWLVQNEANYTLFTVQRSIDNGKTWDNINLLKSSGMSDYSFTDINPVNGLNKYRLQLTDVNGDISLSKELPLMYSNTNTNISNNQVMVYPNPATELINLSIKQTKASLNYNIQLTNSSGVLLKNVNITQLYWQNNVSSLVPGTYVIQVVDNKTKNLLGIAKFVKL